MAIMERARDMKKNEEIALVSMGDQTKMPWIGWLEQQKFISSQFRRLDVETGMTA